MQTTKRQTATADMTKRRIRVTKIQKSITFGIHTALQLSRAQCLSGSQLVSTRSQVVGDGRFQR